MGDGDRTTQPSFTLVIRSKPNVSSGREMAMEMHVRSGAPLQWRDEIHLLLPHAERPRPSSVRGRPIFLPTIGEMKSENLWDSDSADAWRAALDRYEEVVEAQGVKPLPELDRWVRGELPALIAARKTPHVTHDELVRVTEWKMARGVWRARNLALVRGNDPALVERTSADALAKVPHPSEPIAILSKLAGVGPATASAVASAAAPKVYPFFDELVAARIPGMGQVTFTPREYARYADALRDRAGRLGAGWTPAMVERALWAATGGKAGQRKRAG
jgi:hypothetical protein